MTSIAEFLKDSTPANTLLVLDYDGTLHKGLFPPLFKGRANADLGVTLLLRSLRRPLKAIGLLSKLSGIFFLERRLSKDCKRGLLSLSDAEEKLIRSFASEVLARCERHEIERSADYVSQLCHDSAWPFLQALKGRVSMAMVSKSYEFLLTKVAALAKGVYGLEIEHHGVKLGNSGEILPDSVVTKFDKGRKTMEILKMGGFTKALVIGDTEEDVAMRDAAVEALGRDSVLFIAVEAKDAKASAAADLNAASWREIAFK